MKIFICSLAFLVCCLKAGCWGFYAHRQINNYAVFLLPPDMLVFYKAHLGYITEHAVDPDKRRYAVEAEGPRHYIDIDHYGFYPFPALPRSWKEACDKFGQDSVEQYGIVPWWIDIMVKRLTRAFESGDSRLIIKLSAELGHYVADAHVPLHASSNHNGQLSNQYGIHGFWESRIPELLADREWDFFIGHAFYIEHPLSYAWDRVLESARAADTVLRLEAQLNATTPASEKYAFEERNGLLVRQYSSGYTRRYNAALNNMVERRMRRSILSVASYWYTAWVNAGQPVLTDPGPVTQNAADSVEMTELNRAWKSAIIKGRTCN